MIRQICGAVLGVGAFFCLAAVAQAQPTNFGPRPTMSPWFSLYRKDGGPLDNYHTFVRPQLELNDTLQQQQMAIQRNSVGLDTLDQQVGQFKEQGRVVRPTGTASVFMNYSHYYPLQGNAGGVTQGPAVAAPRSAWAPHPASTGNRAITSGAAAAAAAR
jgi:hypothetical protein